MSWLLCPVPQTVVDSLGCTNAWSNLGQELFVIGTIGLAKKGDFDKHNGQW